MKSITPIISDFTSLYQCISLYNGILYPIIDQSSRQDIVYPTIYIRIVKDKIQAANIANKLQDIYQDCNWIINCNRIFEINTAININTAIGISNEII